jgi:hypothetical protein
MGERVMNILYINRNWDIEILCVRERTFSPSIFVVNLHCDQMFSNMLIPETHGNVYWLDGCTFVSRSLVAKAGKVHRPIAISIPVVHHRRCSFCHHHLRRDQISSAFDAPWILCYLLVSWVYFCVQSLVAISWKSTLRPMAIKTQVFLLIVWYYDPEQIVFSKTWEIPE